MKQGLLVLDAILVSLVQEAVVDLVECLGVACSAFQSPWVQEQLDQENPKRG